MELNHKGKTIKKMKEDFIIAINNILGTNEINNIVSNNIVSNNIVTNKIYEFIETIQESKQLYLNEYNNALFNIDKNIVNVNNYIAGVSNTLDNSVYGHKNAKRQIERIIGQWINGDKTGYCFGFEGPPGVGKTSLAKKGIANCLIDENGESRPFAFIAMGGSTNSSTLDGHNYTYVGSSWGRIVDILMDTKIMNPIIFIDELDKVSKTENGKEIIGILTHLIDQTQNDNFQDKYFNGINLNLSKALFIFSYNDVDLIDKILLDRIHRIKFDTINVEDKLVIMRNFILPEIYKKMGLENVIEISDEVIEYIINDYTAEPGVRKLKELMFEIVGEINLNILKNNTLNTIDIPIIITTDDIKSKYLKTHNEIIPTKIHNNPMIGVINGLWANSLGKGGILPIEASFFPSNTFLELTLTGLQGDVMKESMTVAKSLAWSLFVQNSGKAVELQKKLEETKHQGLHIHVPEGATPKDGPSAGTAITIVMYSLFSGLPIKNEVAITGEICLQGRVTAIGGLELKILGGIRAGVKTFIYPKENTNDFNKFMEIYGNKPMIADISFISVEKIEEVIPLIF
jgi:ATP-dependent Lon protease